MKIELLHVEGMPVSGTSLADLDRARLTDYLVRVLGEPNAPLDEPGWEARLIGLGFATQRADGRVACTIAGLVLFGYAPRRALRHVGVRWMSFPGTERDYAAQDDAVLDGPLVGRFRESAANPRDLVEGGLLERLMERMRSFTQSRPAELSDGVRRDSMHRFAPEVVREALLNALVHRDWTRGIEVEVVNYADRLEVTSPGALQNSMTLEKMLAGQPSARNPIITEVLRDYGYVEQRGMGVRRKIVPLTRALAGRDAEFAVTDDYLRVTLPAAADAQIAG